MMAQAVANGLVSGFLLALPALAVSLTFGILRFPNFAIGGMLTAGAYAGWIANTALGLPVAGAALLAAAAAAAIGIACDLLVFERLHERGSITLLVASMGVSLVLENVCRFAFGNTTLSFDTVVTRPIRWMGIRVTNEQILTAVTVLACLVLFQVMLRLTPLGRAMRAVADNAPLAAARGIERRTIVRITWALVGALTGVAGVLAGIDRAVDPLLGWSYQISVFAAAILGGLGSPLGAVAGALVIGLVEELSTLVITPSYRQVVSFAIVLLLLLFRSRGLFGAKAVRA